MNSHPDFVLYYRFILDLDDEEDKKRNYYVRLNMKDKKVLERIKIVSETSRHSRKINVCR